MLKLMPIAMYFAKLYIYTGGLTELKGKNTTAAGLTETLLMGLSLLHTTRDQSRNKSHKILVKAKQLEVLEHLKLNSLQVS